MSTLTCFKAYDIRGKLGDELNEDVAYRIARAFAEVVSPKVVALGADIRLSSDSLKNALAQGFMDAGVNVIDLGMTGTEEVYFAAQHLDIDGAIEVTASHNPLDYNGMKLVRRGAVPISSDTGLLDIRALAEGNDFEAAKPEGARGSIQQVSILSAFVEHLWGYVSDIKLKPLHIVTNAGNGAAGHVIDAIEVLFAQHDVPVRFTKIQHEPDGNFPNGIPNPILPENRAATRDAVIAHKADLGIAWDGDFDRCFLFDEKGRFIEGYYIVGLLAELFLLRSPGSKVVHDPRLVWNTQAIVNRLGGEAIQCKTGHAFIKERMREENAVYGGEMSAHHYFRDFAYCDSGMIPWLLVSRLMTERNLPLSALVDQCVTEYPSSGEINRRLTDAKAAIAVVEKKYATDGAELDYTDGLSISFSEWRFNLRSSNTEPLVRLNVETQGDQKLLKEKTEELLVELDSFCD
jgi:phosphomannomutase